MGVDGDSSEYDHRMSLTTRLADWLYAAFRPARITDAGACHNCDADVVAGEGTRRLTDIFCNQDCENEYVLNYLM